MWERSKNDNATKLLKQVSESEFEYREYGAPRIRPKARYDQLRDLIRLDRPPRTVERSWKKHRKNQYKDR